MYTRKTSSAMHVRYEADKNRPESCAARQPCVNGDWACRWEMANLDPYRIDTP